MVKRKRRAKKLQELPIDNHILMCKHTRVSEAEKKRVFAHYNADETEFPKIRSDDPSIVKLDIKPGDLIRIDRKSITAGHSVAYRVVIDIL